MGRFVELAGGRDAKIAIIPTASTLDDTGARYADAFKALGARGTRIFDIEHRREADDENRIAALDRATGIFMTGGNQLRLATILGGTGLATRIRRRNADGVVVAGTSAGAGFLSEHMVAYGEEGFTPKAQMVKTSAGLGLTNKVIVDQHFRQRDRLGRMFTAISENPFVVGLGVDEDTGALIGPDDVVETVGSGTLTVVDPSDLEYSSLAEAPPGAPICLVGVKLHFLVAGWRFDLRTKKAVAPK